MCVHVFAVALRALVRTAINLPLTRNESAAKGSLLTQPRFKDQALVSAYVHGTTAPPSASHGDDRDRRPSQSSTNLAADAAAESPPFLPYSIEQDISRV